MSVLIKGMEMPKSCLSCPLQGGTADCRLTQKTYNWGLTERPSDCPLIEVPPHGRLIDADAFISRLEHCEEIVSMLRVSIEIKEIYFSLIGEMKEEIENVPTIILADKGGGA